MGIESMKYLFRQALRLDNGSSQWQEDEEDCLKAIYHATQAQVSSTLEAIAQTNNLTHERLAQAIGSLVLKGDIQSAPLRLTEQGRRRALSLVRAHRIYEKYLAEHSGHKTEDWHLIANRMEHHLSPEEQNRMAVLLRNPLFDPHGDPIPTDHLELPRQPQPTRIVAGGWFRVQHIEDDDAELFAVIIRTRLAHHALIQIREITAEYFTFVYEGQECLLPMRALRALSFVAVDTQDPEVALARKLCRLTQLREGEQAQIVGLSPYCRGPMRRRLMDLGFVRGSRVSIELRSPMGNPIAYTVRGTAIALRHDQASCILIERIPS